MLRKFVLIFGDIVLLILAVLLADNIGIDKNNFQINNGVYLITLPLMIGIVGILFNINGLFSLEHKRFAEILLSLVVALLNFFIILMVTKFFMQEFHCSNGVIVLMIALQFLFIAIWKYLFWRLERSLHADIRKVLFIGNEEECIRVFHRLRKQPQFNLQIKYICTKYEREYWQTVMDQIDLLIVCSDIDLKVKAELVHYCNMYNKQILLIPDIYELFCRNAKLDKIDDIPVLCPKTLTPSLEQRLLKRILDIAFSCIVLLSIWPLFFVMAIAIKVFDPGPILYSQIRTGLKEKTFKIYKFRTMRVDAEKYSGPVIATQDDPRITKFGRFMRATRMDELPQIWNVLVGEMSIVGPRPERPYFVEQFKKEIPEYIYRHNVKPGITGLAQVYGKYNTTAYDKLVYDLMYVQKCNVMMDVVIILKTVKILLMKDATEGKTLLDKQVSFKNI